MLTTGLKVLDAILLTASVIEWAYKTGKGVAKALARQPKKTTPMLAKRYERSYA